MCIFFGVHFPKSRPDPILLPESFCLPLRLRHRRPLSGHSSGPYSLFSPVFVQAAQEAAVLLRRFCILSVVSPLFAVKCFFTEKARSPCPPLQGEVAEPPAAKPEGSDLTGDEILRRLCLLRMTAHPPGVPPRNARRCRRLPRARGRIYVLSRTPALTARTGSVGVGGRAKLVPTTYARRPSPINSEFRIPNSEFFLAIPAGFEYNSTG